MVANLDQLWMGKYFPFSEERRRLWKMRFPVPEPRSGLYTFENMAVNFKLDEHGMALVVLV